MPVLLSDDEMEALSGLPHLHFILYVRGIRKYMDYKTGRVGIKRGISYQSLTEEVFIKGDRGIRQTFFSHDQIKRALKQLEKIGLIKRMSVIKKDDKQLILECCLAQSDRSIQNKAAPTPPRPPAPEAAPIETSGYSVKIDVKEEIKNKDALNVMGATLPKAAPPPVSGKDIKHNNTGVVFFELTQIMGLSEIAATKLLDKNTEKYILEKLKLVMDSTSYRKGNIKNLPAYFQKAIADDFKGVQSIKESNREQKRGDVKGALCNVPECKKKGIKNFTMGTRWCWFCDEHLKIEQEREKVC